MHEMSIAVEMMRQIERLVAEHGVDRVEEVTVVVGVLRQVVPEALTAAFEAASTGTSAEGARLHIETAPACVRCRGCGEEFSPAVDAYLCSRCGRADVDIIEGNEIVIGSLTCEREEASEGRPTKDKQGE
jgi:hydrogenase nickel incorporation protein HypA/HybF